MKQFFATAILLASSVTATSEVESAFLKYITNFGKSYSTISEYQFRLEQFSRNYAIVLGHNASESSFQLGFNQMSDWTQDEYSAILTYVPAPEAEENYTFFEENNAVANAVNWVTAGAVQAIKDQGQCGSCWAFSTVSAMESAHQIKSGKLLSFSEQQLVDCSTQSPNRGCNGGNQGVAMNYYQTYAAESESTYPYRAVTSTCKYNSGSTTGVKSTGFSNVTKNSVTQMKAALSHQPLSVSIEADKSVFQSYRGGIFNSSLCGTSLDHATNVVGWGTSGNVEYWLMRNSWGTWWGESGYMRIQIVDGAGICGIQMSPLYPNVAN